MDTLEIGQYRAKPRTEEGVTTSRKAYTSSEVETEINLNKLRSYSMSKAHKLAYAAGFFDGEGYVTVQIRGGQYKGHYIRIGVNHVHPIPLYEMQRLFGGTVRKQNPAKVKGNRKQRHEWSISCNKAAAALSQMLPYMLYKNKVSELALSIQSTMGTTIKVSDEIVAYRQSLKEEIQRINALD